ncbi:transcription initiation factor IIB [Halogranum amylolyticum]|uniref:transcription initiation factor IIB n=1 Tax=Halogranum amylolyticum TaxID=660520 RepID=UPI00148001A7|nr:transcription initiation factor IIB family protein [Halogranum amylolyticum]
MTDGHESFCRNCGLVVTAEHVDHQPTRSVHGPRSASGPEEWSCEPVTNMRIDKGLHTTFFLGSDGHGRTLTSKQRSKYGRLKQRHKRFQVESDRAIRLNEGYRDIESIGGNLGLPRHVVGTAGRYLKQAAEERLPGGHMSWEALAGGAVLIAANEAGFPRSISDVVQYAKASHERVSAAARKLRCDLGLDVAPVRVGVVDDVLAALDDVLNVQTCLKLRRIAERLLEMADTKRVGSGTTRLTMAAAAVYAADRLTDGKALTQAQVAAAGSTVVDTTKNRIAAYSQELHDVFVAQLGSDDPMQLLERGRNQVH